MNLRNTKVEMVSKYSQQDEGRINPHRMQNLSSQTCILTVVLVEEELLTKSEWDIGLPTQPVYLMNSQYSGFSDEDAFRSHHTQEMHYALSRV